MQLQKERLLLLLLCCTHIVATWASKNDAFSNVCNVLDFGARGDNRTEDTKAIQAAIDHCSQLQLRKLEALRHKQAVDQATVLLPAGHAYLSRPLLLRSHVNLHIQRGAILVAWPDLPSWPNSTVKKCSISPYTDPKPVLVPQLESLLYVRDAVNVAITGDNPSPTDGTGRLTHTATAKASVIDGQGWRWWPLRFKNQYWHNCRPRTIEAQSVTGLELIGFTVLDSPMYNIAAHALRDAHIENVTLHAGCGYNNAPNTDGFNLSGLNISVRHCSVHNGDDCVPINVGSFTTIGTPRHGAPSHLTANVSVEDVQCACGNGVVPIIWSRPGTITNVSFTNIVLNRTSEAITIKSLPPFNGTVKNVIYENITLVDVAEAVNFNAFDQVDGRAEVLPGIMKMDNIVLRNVRGSATAAGNIRCGPGAGCAGFLFDNVVVKTNSSYSCLNAHVKSVASSPPPCQALGAY